MGKPIKTIKPSDQVILGITNRIGDYRLLFLETDTKDRIKKLMVLLHEYFLDDKLHTYILYETSKGFHFICFNLFDKGYSESVMFDFRDCLDRYHVGYSIAKNFVTLRLSRKRTGTPYALCVVNIGSLPVSRPHWELYNVLLPITRNKQKAKGRGYADFAYNCLLKRHDNVKDFFDKGIEFVGYVIDGKTKKRNKVGMIFDGQSIRTIQTKN